MSSRTTHTPSHPVAHAVARLHDQLDDMLETPVWSMNTTDTGHTLTQLTRLAARLEALTLKVAAHADRTDVGDTTGATSTAVWWAHHTRMTQREAATKMKLAKALDSHEPVADTLATGALLQDQAAAIVNAVDRLPEHIEPDVRVEARQVLLAAAKDFDAKALRIQGRRILDIVAPEIGEAEEARQLAAEERKAEQAARLTMHDDGHGQTHGRFTLPTHEADLLRKPLHALAAPKAGGQGATPHGMGLALIEYLHRFPRNKLPKAGGIPATVVVTMSYETLLGGLKAAHLDTGTPISPALARKWACQAGIIPLVLGSKSEPLDVGRTRRFHTEAMRIAMHVRDQGCATHGCERPGSWCHAHHLTPWSEGGPTSVKDGVLLCPRHHTLAHHQDYDLTHHPDGKISFHRRE
jgi:hypothetical protein